MTAPSSSDGKRGAWTGIAVAVMAACCALLPAVAGALAGGAIVGKAGALVAVIVAVGVAGVVTVALRRRRATAC